jgi:hypothetical protein
MPILDPSFREQLRAKSKSRESASSGSTDRDSLRCEVDARDESGPSPALDRGTEERLLLTRDNLSDLDVISVAPLPEMLVSWWESLLLGDANALVSSENVGLVFRHILRRLADRETAPNAGWDDPAQLLHITTIGELHEAVQSLGALAWFEFQRAYHEAAGLKPKRQPKPACDPFPVADPHDTPDTPLPPLPDRAPYLDPDLHAALPTMNPRAVGFLLHAPKDPPAWRYSESPNEKAIREQLENEGCWTG